MARRLAPGLVPMARVRDAGRRTASVDPVRRGRSPSTSPALTEVLAEHDEAILRAFVQDEAALAYPRLRTHAGRADPTGRSSTRSSSARPPTAWASTELLAGIAELLSGARGDPEAPVSGRVFKIERTASGERVAYVRLFAGTLRPRERVRVGGEEAKATAIRVFAPGRRAAKQRRQGRGDGRDLRPRHGPGRGRDRRAAAGRRRGDALPAPDARGRRLRPATRGIGPAPRRARPSSPTRTRSSTSARTSGTRSRSRSTARSRRRSSGATLERDYGIDADFRETTVVCIERPAHVGEADEVIRAKTHTNITGRSSPLSDEPVQGDAGAPDRAGAAGLRDRVPHRRRGPPRPALPVPHASRRSRRRWRRTSARRWPRAWPAGR